MRKISPFGPVKYANENEIWENNKKNNRKILVENDMKMGRLKDERKSEENKEKEMDREMRK